MVPAGSEIKFTTLPGLEVRANPIEFYVMHRWMVGKVEGDPRKPGFAQDTGYWSDDKKSAGAFYAYLKDNFAKVSKMNIKELIEVWHDLGVKFRSH